jgi:phosphopantothenoylcysteine decarboxylase/phosphopantothenate--cysteine ligase
MMAHVNLVKWADFVICAPATANTINKMATGDGSILVTALFLAHDFDKPYFIAPAMNTKMLSHPATQISLAKLNDWGATILGTGSGALACGDEGWGRMLEPEEILSEILEKLNPASKKKVLITSGGTREPIDAVRYITNLSSGRTGAAIADEFNAHNWKIYYLHGSGAKLPKRPCFREHFNTAGDLKNGMKKILKKHKFSAIIHLAAISDYFVVGINGQPLNRNTKIESSGKTLNIKLKPTPKIAEKIRSWCQGEQTCFIPFKLTSSQKSKERLIGIENLFKKTDADYVVHNDVSDRQNGSQTNFQILEKESMKIFSSQSSEELAQSLIKICTKFSCS